MCKYNSYCPGTVNFICFCRANHTDGRLEFLTAVVLNIHVYNTVSKCGLVTDVSTNHSVSIFGVKQFNKNSCSSWAIPLGQYDRLKWCQLLRQQLQLQPTTTAYCVQTMPSLLETEKPYCMAAPQLTQSAAVPRVREIFCNAFTLFLSVSSNSESLCLSLCRKRGHLKHRMLNQQSIMKSLNSGSKV